MQNDTSQYVVNIIPLQNIQQNTSGLDATTELSNSVANIQQMVNFDQKRIYTDFLSAYTAGNTIQVLSPMNMSNTILTTDGIINTNISSNDSLAVSTLTVTGSGTFGGTVSATGFITLSDVLMKKNVIPVTGPVLEGICTLQPYLYEYKSQEGQLEIGLLAQEIESVFPEAVLQNEKGTRYVKYDAIVALLVGAVKELKEEIRFLKGVQVSKISGNL